jgi:hypothetical protein
MTNALSSSGSLSIFDGTSETEIVGLAGGRLSLAGEIARRSGRFLLIWQRGAHRVEIPFSGQVEDDGHAVSFEDGETAGVVASATTTDDVEQLLFESALDAPVAPARKKNNAGWIMRAAVALGCAALGGYDAIRLYHGLITITPRMAYLATEVSTITAPTSGTLTFAAPPGDIATGEPIIGIQNARGKTVLVDATENVRIVVQDKAIGDNVKRGEPLLAVADRNPPTYIVAVLPREEAFRLSSGAQVRYGFLHEPTEATRMVDIAGDAFELSRLPDDGNPADAQLYRVRFRIPDDTLARAEPIVLEFRQGLATRAQGWLATSSLPTTITAPALTALQATDALLRRLEGEKS